MAPGDSTRPGRGADAPTNQLRKDFSPTSVPGTDGCAPGGAAHLLRPEPEEASTAPTSLGPSTEQDTR